MDVRHPSFFFSSRRRHTRFDCDWSSDVCSSDLMKLGAHAISPFTANVTREPPTNIQIRVGVRSTVAAAWRKSSNAVAATTVASVVRRMAMGTNRIRSEEHTSELQSQSNLVCRLLLE